MVRVRRDDLIDLLRGALRAHELEAEAQALAAERETLLRESADCRRGQRGRALIAAQTAAAGLALGEDRVAELLTDLPQTATGDLHEPAFLALLGQHLLERRLGADITTTGDPR